MPVSTSPRIPLWSWLLFLALSISSARAADDPLAAVAEQARGYAAALARAGASDWTGEERAALAATSDLLRRRNHCDQALSLGKQALSGPFQPGYRDWRGLALAARCAGNRNDAVMAAYLAYGSAGDQKQRFLNLALLGAALEDHWRFGAAEALAAYRLALQNGDDAGVRERAEKLAQQVRSEGQLRLDRQYVNAEGTSPAICLDFSATMPEPADVRYGDFIRFEPDFGPRFRVRAGDEVCAEGARFGGDYQVRVLAGLQGTGGQRLPADLKRRVQVDHREPTLWFANSRYVLPPGGGVPLHGINVRRAALELFRVDERNLLDDDIRRRFRSDLSAYQVRRLRDELGEQVWRGEAQTAMQPDREAVTRLPLGELARPRPGVYVLTARPLADDGKAPDDDGARAAQWLVVSDLGLTTYRGADGLTVAVRSLSGAQPLPGQRLVLYARNNSPLGEVHSDADGLARFGAALLDGSGGREPVLLAAFGAGGDFNFFDVSGAPFDLSDRGVGGRPQPGPVDAFLYTERGVYRPGERVNLAVLLRDPLGRALDGLPLTLRLLRPDGQVAAEQVMQPAGGGGYATVIPVSAAARTGRWTVRAYLDREADPVGSTGFLVEAILPPRIEVAVDQAPDTPLAPGEKGRFGIRADYLFGAPAADLAATAELHIAPDPDPFPALAGYRFGPVDEADDSVLLPLAATRTDAAGHALFSFDVQRLPKVRRPLRAELRAEVTDVDGRAVAAVRRVPVRARPLLIGVRPAGEAGVVEEGAEARFQVRTLDRLGRGLARDGLAWRLVEEVTDYRWFREEGRWRYKSQVHDRTLREGTLAVSADDPAPVSLPLDFGRYRLEVRDPESGAFTSVRVRSGWGGGGRDLDTPDRLRLGADRPRYGPGETARLRVQSPFAGPASLVIATDRVLSVRNLVLEGREQVLEVPVDGAWGAGAYALVTAYRPDAGEAGHGPRRAVGVAWLGLDPQLHRLDLALAAPERVRPLEQLSVGVQVTGQGPDEPLYLTLAAVDEGVLQLTGYRTPDPLGHYFGRRVLGVGLRDLYGRLIDGHAGIPGTIRSGGGAPGRRGAPDSEVRILSLFSGVVRPDADGKARIPFRLPAFDGRLRLTAVAWSPARVGSARAAVTVRDPVVLLPSVPRFLAAGDRSRATLSLHNLEGAAGDYRLSWRTEGAVAVDGDGTRRTLALGEGERKRITLPLTAGAVGRGRLHLALRAPDGTLTRREAVIGVRAPFLPEGRRRLGQLAPGAEVALGTALVQGLRPETVTASLGVSDRPDLDVPGLLRQLDLYPYGCAEQVTSRAFPLLHLERLAARWDYHSRVPVRERLEQAVASLLERQLGNGGFALWRPDGEEAPWLSAYVLDFLSRARAGGVEVPDFAWERGLDWLRRRVTYPATDDKQAMAVQAYALYLLARAGERHDETARYLWDQLGEALPSGLSVAQLGAALALMGDVPRAARAFELAIERVEKGRREPGLGDYGSPLRDQAALVQLLAESGREPDRLAGRVARLAENLADEQWLSTQERAWLVRAAAAVSGEAAPLRLAVAGATLPPRDTPLVLHPGADTLTAGLVLANRGEAPAWYNLTLEGSPLEPPPVLAAGLEIRRSLHALDGKVLDPEELHQGQPLVVVLEGRALDRDTRHQALVLDPLPAGLEVENPSLANARGTGDLGWLGALSDTLYSEVLDDRYVAALDLEPEQAFRLAYLARAVSPGHYRAGPALVEDMYKPRFRGRGESGWVEVVGE